MQEADGRVELGVVDVVERKGIAHHVAERDGGVHLVGGRLLVPAVHGEVLDDVLEGLVVDLPAVALHAHEGGHVPGFRYAQPQLLQLCDQAVQVPAPGIVVAEVLEHIEAGPAHQALRDVHSALAAEVGPRLLDLHLARKQVLAGLEAARVVLVIIEKVDRYALLAQEVEQGAVGVHAAKDVEGLYGRYRQVAGLLLVAQLVHWGELKGVVAPRHAAGVEKVVRLLHLRWFIRRSRTRSRSSSCRWFSSLVGGRCPD